MNGTSATDDLIDALNVVEENAAGVRAAMDHLALAYQEADLDARVAFIGVLNRRLFDFFEHGYGGPAYPGSPEEVVLPPPPATQEAAPDTPVVELERMEAAYESSIETHGEKVAAGTLEGWRDELGKIRLRLEQARVAVEGLADFGPVAVAVEGALDAATDLVGGAAEGLDILEDAGVVGDGTPSTEADGTASAMEDGTLGTEEDGSPLETEEAAAAADEEAEEGGS